MAKDTKFSKTTVVAAPDLGTVIVARATVERSGNTTKTTITTDRTTVAGRR